MKANRGDWEKELRHFPLNPQGVPAKLKQNVEERIAMDATPKRYTAKGWIAAAALLLASAGLFAEREAILGLFRPDPGLPPFDITTERSVKVQWVDGMSFMSRYGDAFIIRHPNMDVETVNTPRFDPQQDRTAQFAEMIERDKPDLVYVPIDVYRELAAQGMLLPLDPLFGKDAGLKPDDFRDGIIDMLRAAGGDGKLYGLVPEFTANALYYNQSLFDKYGVPYPTDRMSWDELFRLAQRFPAGGEGDSRVYGLEPAETSVYGAVSAVGRTLSLALFDPASGTMTADTTAWRGVWQFAADGVKKGWLYQYKPSSAASVISGIDYYKRSPFMTGQTAMKIGWPSLAHDLTEANKQYGLADFAWDIVTEPVDPGRPNRASSLFFDGIYAIPARSPNAADAWELLKLIHSEPLAKKIAVQYAAGLGLSTLKSFDLTSGGFPVEAFTALRPDPDVLSRTTAANDKLPAIVNEEIQAAAAGTKSLDAAVAAIQQRGQQALEQAEAAKRAQ